MKLSETIARNLQHRGLISPANLHIVAETIEATLGKPEVKPWWKSRGFMGAVFSTVALLALFFFGKLDTEQSAIVIAAIIGNLTAKFGRAKATSKLTL